MRYLPIIAVYLYSIIPVWAANSTTHVQTNGTTIFTPNAGEIGVIGPYGYQPVTPNTVGVIGPIAPVGPVENTPITTEPLAAPNNPSNGKASTHSETVYGNCYQDDKGQSVHALVSWECHAADETVISAGSCQTPAAITPCN
jgi:hypothetical protein